MELNEIFTRMVAREVFTSIQSDGASVLKLGELEAEDDFFYVTDPKGKRYRVAVTDADGE